MCDGGKSSLFFFALFLFLCCFLFYFLSRALLSLLALLQLRVFLLADSSVAVPAVLSALRFNPNVTFSRLGACTPEIDSVACAAW